MPAFKLVPRTELVEWQLRAREHERWLNIAAVLLVAAGAVVAAVLWRYLHFRIGVAAFVPAFVAHSQARRWAGRCDNIMEVMGQ